MNTALKNLVPLLTVSLNEGGTEGGAGGGGEAEGQGEGAGDGANSTADGKGGESKDTKAAPPPAADEAAKKAAAAATAELSKSYETWKPKLPEGMPFDDKGFGDYRKLFTESGIKPEQAQKFVDAFANGELNRLKAVAEGLKREQQEWSKTLLADKELAGEGTDAERKAKVDGTMSAARRAMGKLATPGFRELLKKSGLESHPEMIRVMSRIGAGMAEDSTKDSRAGGKGPEPTAKQKLQSRYPNSKEMFSKD